MSTKSFIHYKKKQTTGYKNKIIYVILDGGMAAIQDKNRNSSVDATWRVKLTSLSVYAQIKYRQVSQ